MSMSITLFTIIVGIVILISWKNFRPASILASISLFLILFAYFWGYRGDVSADPNQSGITNTIATVVNSGEALFWASILLMSILMFIKLYKAVGQTRSELEKELEKLKEAEEELEAETENEKESNHSISSKKNTIEREEENSSDKD